MLRCNYHSFQLQEKQLLPTLSPVQELYTACPEDVVMDNLLAVDAQMLKDQEILKMNGSGVAVETTYSMDTSRGFQCN